MADMKNPVASVSVKKQKTLFAFMKSSPSTSALPAMSSQKTLAILSSCVPKSNLNDRCETLPVADFMTPSNELKTTRPEDPLLYTDTASIMSAISASTPIAATPITACDDDISFDGDITMPCCDISSSSGALNSPQMLNFSQVQMNSSSISETIDLTDSDVSSKPNAILNESPMAERVAQTKTKKPRKSAASVEVGADGETIVKERKRKNSQGGCTDTEASTAGKPPKRTREKPAAVVIEKSPEDLALIEKKSKSIDEWANDFRYTICLTIVAFVNNANWT